MIYPSDYWMFIPEDKNLSFGDEEFSKYLLGLDELQGSRFILFIFRLVDLPIIGSRILKYPTRAIRQKKEVKGIQSENKDIKLSLYPNDFNNNFIIISDGILLLIYVWEALV